MKLKTVTLRGHKSIAKQENFELRNLNVLIGANGADKIKWHIQKNYGQPLRLESMNNDQPN